MYSPEMPHTIALSSLSNKQVSIVGTKSADIAYQINYERLFAKRCQMNNVSCDTGISPTFNREAKKDAAFGAVFTPYQLLSDCHLYLFAY